MCKTWAEPNSKRVPTLYTTVIVLKVNIWVFGFVQVLQVALIGEVKSTKLTSGTKGQVKQRLF